MGDKGEESIPGKKFEKGGEDSLWNGPVKKRCCTDIICIPIFIVHILAFYALTFMNASDGNPGKLVAMRDFKGDYCGLGSDAQWKGGDQPNLEGFEKQMWSMNLDETFGVAAKALVCSAAGSTTLVSPGLDISGVSAANQLTKEQFAKYCGFSVDPLGDAAAAISNLTGSINDGIKMYSDPSQAVKLFSGSSQMGASIMKSVTKYFVPVCAKSCDMAQNSSTSTRVYTYKPTPIVMWGSDPEFRAIELWKKFVAELEAKGQSSMLSAFNFNTWPEDICPYKEAKYCVPMPGTTFGEVGNFGLCAPKVDSAVGAYVGNTAKESLTAISQLSVTEDAKVGMGQVIGDCLKTYDVFIIVACLSLVAGLVTLVLMRFILKPLIWASLILVFLIFIAGGLLIVVRSNQCADQALVDAADSQKSAFSASGSQATGGNFTNPFDAECPGGFSIQSEDARTAAKYCGYFVIACGVAWLLVVMFMFNRIRLAIGINLAACEFLAMNPQSLFVPIIQAALGLMWVLLWIYCAALILSQVGTDRVPTKAFATYAESFGTSSEPGACTDTWPAGDVYVDQDGANCTGSAPLCYRCTAPRFIFDYKFGYAFLSLLWNNFFIIAVGQTTIAGAVGIWFFTERGQKLTKTTTIPAAKNALFWHAGSLAFGSLVLAIIVWIKWFMYFLKKQAEQRKNKVAVAILTVLGCFIWCFEKCAKFLTKNAYIQVALMGTNFCTSAKSAFGLITRNFLRIGVIALLSHVVHVVAMLLICSLTALVGYFILEVMYPDVNPIAPTILYFIIGWMCAKLFIGVFAMAVDATLQCFIAAEEMDAGNSFAPTSLKTFIDSNQEKESKACDGCCCTIM